MTCELLGLDPMAAPPAHIQVEYVREIGVPNQGLVMAASVVKYGVRPPTWAQVDAWCDEHGLPNQARAWQQHKAKADTKRAEDTVEREREEQRKRDAENRPPTADDIRAMFDGDPVPLTTDVLPSFPMTALPGAYRDMALATAVAYQVHPAMVGPVVLAALAAACGGRVEAALRPGWEEVAALHVLVAAPPSERKSAVIKALTAPLMDAQRELLDLTRPRRADAIARREIVRDAAQIAKTAAAKAAAGDAKTAAEIAKTKADGSDATTEPSDPFIVNPVIAHGLEMARQVEEIVIPPIPRMLADDVTTEALTSLMADHGGAMAVISAEGGVFDTLAGKYAHKVPSLDIWLKGYSGDPVMVDRKGRDSEFIERPVLTVCLMLQPVVLSKIGHNEDFKGRGLLARALFALPTPMRGHRDSDPPPVPEGVAKAYHAALADLACELRDTGDDTEHGPARVKFDPDTARDVVALLDAIEPRLLDPADLGGGMEAWAGKYVGNVGRIALLLHMGEHGPAGVDIPVSAETFAAARRIGEFFMAHSVAALGFTVAADTDRLDAVLDALRDLHAAAPLQPITLRSLQKHRAARRLKLKAHELDAVLETLADHYMVRRFSVKVGGRDQVKVYLHPDAAS